MIWDEESFSAYCDGIAMVPADTSRPMASRVAWVVGAQERLNSDFEHVLVPAVETAIGALTGFAAAYEAAVFREQTASLAAAQRAEQRRVWQQQRRRSLARQRRKGSR